MLLLPSAPKCMWLGHPLQSKWCRLVIPKPDVLSRPYDILLNSLPSTVSKYASAVRTPTVDQSELAACSGDDQLCVLSRHALRLDDDIHVAPSADAKATWVFRHFRYWPLCRSSARRLPPLGSRPHDPRDALLDDPRSTILHAAHGAQDTAPERSECKCRCDEQEDDHTGGHDRGHQPLPTLFILSLLSPTPVFFDLPLKLCLQCLQARQFFLMGLPVSSARLAHATFHFVDTTLDLIDASSNLIDASFELLLYLLQLLRRHPGEICRKTSFFSALVRDSFGVEPHPSPRFSV